MKDNTAILFNDNWKFLLGDAKNARQMDYPDQSWKRVDLPHDWVISQPYQRGTGGYTPQNMQGFFAWEGIAWYRKEFSLPALNGKNVSVYFGGAYRNSTVYVNGQEAGGRAYGYSSFELDISALAREGRNVIAVRLDNGCEAPDRWYSGSGLFRDVYVKIMPENHIKTWGVCVKPELKPNKKLAVVSVDAAIVGNSAPASGKLKITIIASDNETIAEKTVPVKIKKQGEITISQKLRITEPMLWSAETPNLYRALLCLEPGKKRAHNATHQVEIPFGIRTVKIQYKKGMTVNGEAAKLKGVCLHHDAGICGSAYYGAVWRRRLKTLKYIGCNAIRTSHNPPAEEFLDLCDELGFYVIDECFDKWKSGYYAKHFDADARRDLEDFILRDRNHPSVFMWSIGNEVENQGEPSMLALQKSLVSIVRALDERPVTCGLEPHVHPKNLIGAPVNELVKRTKKLAHDVDVLGFNYHEPLYADYTAAIEKPIVGTECYEFYSSNALNYEEMNGKNPWDFVQENSNVIGQFIWAGIDYLGECTWPAKGWTGAFLDICGFMKPNAWFRKSIWSSEPIVYIGFSDQGVKPNYARGRWSFPPIASHLNLDSFQGRTVTAVIFTNCDEVELLVNGKKMGKRQPGDFPGGIIEMCLEYFKGEVKAIGYCDGSEVCSHTLKTAGPARKITLIPDKKNLLPGCADIAHVEINITDSQGIPCPHEDVLLGFSLTGDGEILGACSPDLNSHLGFTQPRVITSDGKALLLIKAGASPGTLKLTAYAENLETGTASFKVKQDG